MKYLIHNKFKDLQERIVFLIDMESGDGFLLFYRDKKDRIENNIFTRSRQLNDGQYFHVSSKSN